MGRPCNHPDNQLPEAGGDYAPPACRHCWLYVNRPEYKTLWDGPPAPRPKTTTKMSVLEAKRRGLYKPKPGGCGCKKKVKRKTP